MSEHPHRAGLVVPLLVAVAVLGLGFGGGVLAGRATGTRAPRTTDKSEGFLSERVAKEELAACRRELEDLAKPRATVSASVTPSPGETKDGGLEKAAKVEALQKEVNDCRVRETLVKAHVCGTMTDHDNLLFVLAYSSSCEDEARVGELIIDSYDKCAEFDAFPNHLDREQLTQGERTRIADAQRNHRYKGREDVAKGVRESLRRCREKFGLPDK